MNEIQKMRKLTGLSQSKFATYLGIPVSTVRQWERNGAKPPQYVIVMISKVLKYEGLLTEEDVKWCIEKDSINYCIDQK